MHRIDVSVDLCVMCGAGFSPEDEPDCLCASSALRGSLASMVMALRLTTWGLAWEHVGAGASSGGNVGYQSCSDHRFSVGHILLHVRTHHSCAFYHRTDRSTTEVLVKYFRVRFLAKVLVKYFRACNCKMIWHTSVLDKNARIFHFSH
jgi:hypothetical protein